MAEPTPPPGNPALRLLTQRRGPLPTWAWVLILVALLVLVVVWRRNQRAPADLETVGDQTPPPVFVVPSATPPVVNVTIPPTKATPPTATVPTAPPGGGRATPPGAGTAGGVTVTVKRFTKINPPWESTLSGIYSHYKGQTTAKSWQDIWGAPQNATLRTLRGAPEKIRSGDRIFVPGVK